MNIKTFVINLKRRKDRRERIRSIIPTVLDVEFTSDLGIDIDGSSLSASLLDRIHLFPWQINSNNPWWCRPLKKGEIGCALSHLHCWKHIVDRKITLSLILEDDVTFSDEFVTKLELILNTLEDHYLDWELLYLGRKSLEKDRPLLDNLVKPSYSYGTFAYMITYDAACKLLNTHFEHDLIPVDEFISAMCTPHPRHDVNKRFKPDLNAYAINPSIVFSLPIADKDSDTENSDFVT